MANKQKDEVLSTNIPVIDASISINLTTDSDLLSATLSEQNDKLTDGISQLMNGISDVRVKNSEGEYESVVDSGIAYIDTPTTEYVDEKIEAAVAPIRTELSIITPKVNELSIIVPQHTEQLSVLNSTVNSHTEHLSILDTQVNNINLSLLKKLDTDLSIIQTELQPSSLSIESAENLLVYLYNTQDKAAVKAKLSELGVWDVK